jgi:hypothetical protein
MQLIDLFKEIITGDFDNSRQVEAEIKAGKQIHPFAKHINRVCNDKIKNLPNDLNGFFVLEESYYDYPGKPTEIKPFLFLFQQGENNTITLKVFQTPQHISKEEFTNSNNFILDYLQLSPSPTFKGAVYTYDAAAKTFFTCAPNHLPNGITFTLTETFSQNQLIVMELVEKNGVRVTPYETPIVYDRK